MTRSARYHARRRSRLLDRLGNTCNACGFDSLFTGPLEIDHRKGGGNANRSMRGNAGEITYALSLPDSILHEFFQALCEDCHRAKTNARYMESRLSAPIDPEADARISAIFGL